MTKAKKKPVEQTKGAVMLRTIRPEKESFSVRAEGGGPVRIAGYANKFGLDSYGTRIDPGTCRLDRFNKNGILLFNHNVDSPVGKVTKVECREDGVFVECEISQSTNERVSYVRDLVREGCLKTFSIRFDPEAKMEKDTENPGNYIIKDWELQEVSIVSLPAQPDSTFSLRHARGVLANCRTLDEARKAVLNVRGVKVAKCVKDAIKMASDGGVSEEELMEKLHDACGLDAAGLAAVLDGEVTPVPDQFIQACVDLLGCSKEELDGLNAEDVESSAKPAENPSEAERAEGDAPPPVEPGKEPAPGEPPPVKPELEMDEAMQKCVGEKIPKLMQEGKSQEEAVAVAISMCSEERGVCGWRPKEADLARYLEIARQATQDPSGPTVPVEAPEVNDNPMLQKLDTLAALLGALIQEVKALSQVMIGHEAGETPAEEMAVPPPADGEKKPEEVPPAEDQEAMRAIAEGFARLEARLQSISL
jgi:HK97 family phage prohead protease